MNARIVRPDSASESPTEERCFVLESWNHESDPAVSIARARVAPGVTTQLHSVDVDERYVIVAGGGKVEVGDLPPAEVALGDVVVIPAGAPQRITNNRDEDLVFYCICAFSAGRVRSAGLAAGAASAAGWRSSVGSPSSCDSAGGRSPRRGRS